MPDENALAEFPDSQEEDGDGDEQLNMEAETANPPRMHALEILNNDSFQEAIIDMKDEDEKVSDI